VGSITQPRWKDQPQSKGIHIELTKNLGDIPPSWGAIRAQGSSDQHHLQCGRRHADGGADHGHHAAPGPRLGRVRIADTGVGMTEDVKRRVFDPFFTTKGVTNSGLGMSVSYGIIKRHGGEVLIESEPERAQPSSSTFP